MSYLLFGNCHGLIVDVRTIHATGGAAVETKTAP
jgi:hypothetical protein